MKGGSALPHYLQVKLEDYQYTVLHCPRKLQGHMDRLSRLPKAIHVSTPDPAILQERKWVVPPISSMAKFNIVDGLTLDDERQMLLGPLSACLAMHTFHYARHSCLQMKTTLAWFCEHFHFPLRPPTVQGNH